MNEITNTSSTPTVQFHPDTPKKTVADWVRDMRMSPSVNEKNTGIKTDQVTPDLMLATSKKLLDISRGKQEPDPKDSLDFQRFYGPAEYFAEHILRDGGKLGRNLLWKATNRGNLDFMSTNALDKHISSVFYDSKLAQMMDGASPLETVDSAYKMTRLGEGGIGDIDSAPDEMRTVQPSYFGFIDPVRCYAIGTEVLTEMGWRPIEKIEKDEKVWTLEDGIPDFRPVKETLKFGYQGPMVAYEDDLVAFSVTPHHRMHVKIDGEWTKRYAEEVFNTSVVINVGEKTETQHQLLDSKWEMTKADGYVYCLTVPGGIFYCRYKKLHGLWCGNSPESLRVGLDMYATKNVMKGSDGRLYQKFINARTGKEELVDSEKAARSVVASSEMRNANTKSIFALGGPTGVRIVPKSSVDYYLPRADEAYSTSSNLVPMLSAVKEMRLLMGCLHPMTPILTLSNKNEINIVPAQEVTAKNMSIPGSDKDGQSKLYDMRNSIAKFPPKRFWFKKITLMSGRTIVTSYDHKWPIIKNGKMVLQEARKLKEGDTVLRTTFKDVPSRRTFTRRTYVGSNVGYTMGLMARSLYLPDKGKIRFQLPSGYNCLAIEDALTSLGVKEFTIYNKMGARYVGITDEDFITWIDKVMGIRPENRRIPSFILSARVDVVGSFINGYTLDKNLVGQDAMESYWILELPNVLFRDSIAFLLSRIGTDCLYRECHRDGQLSLALRLVEPNPAWGDMILDSIKCVQNAQSCPIMIDIDIDDNMYVTASGILTHNSKYPLQAISLEARETPLVRTLDEATGKSMQQLIGKYLGAQFAKQGGTVTAVRKDRIDVLYDDGKKGSVPLYVNFPMNAKGYISNTPSVKAGDTFKPGQLLAYSNYTDKNGDAALGINLRSAYMSWKGGTYEDAVVISESAADKLKSTTMYKTAVDLDRTVKLGKQNYMTWKPGEYTKEQMDLLDNNGIVKPGTVLHKGDPMILAVQTTEPSPGTMGKRILTDMSETWEHDHPGVVTDVVKTRKGVKVFATVTAPAEVGDKIAGLYGNKGMIAQIVPDDQMPHNAKGEPLELIMSPLGITSRCYDEQTEFLTREGWKFGKDITEKDLFYCYNRATETWEWGEQINPFWRNYYEGTMYGFHNQATDFLVTPGHRVWCRTDFPGSSLQEKHIEEIFGKRYYIPCVAERRHYAVDPTPFVLPTIELKKKDTFTSNEHIEFEAHDWAEFLGWYLAEGNTTFNEDTMEYRVNIAQFDTVNKENVIRITALLDRLGLKWHYGTKNKQFHIRGKRMASYMKQFGHAWEKFIPDWLFEQPDSVIERFLYGIMEGDGSYYPAGNHTKDGKQVMVRTIALTSEKLIDQLQILFSMLGIPANKFDVREDKRYTDAHRIYRLGICTIDKHYRLTRNPGWYKQQYSGMTYCPTVRSGYIMTRRNGKLICMGNTNPSQLFEAQLGKIARKTGKPETMPPFMDQDIGEYVLNRLKQNHMTPDEDLTDPETGRTIPDVLTGVSYIHKLKHLAESKMSARGTDEYTAEGLPGGKGMTGCFPAMQNIMTIHGEKSIATICEKRQPEWVLTWDGTQYCYKQVTDWFIRRSDTADLLNISLRYNLSTTGNNAVRHTTSIYPTLNHHMYKADMSVVEAGELKVGDKLAGIGFIPTEDQKRVMLGTLLGDSYRTQSNMLACMHSCKQLDFITWKYEMLKGLNATLSSGYYKTTESVVVSGRTIKATLAKTLTVSSSAAVEEIMNLVYGGTQDRHITRQVLDNLGELGLCVWMMDDGSMHNHSHNKGKVHPEAKLCTQGFSCAETEIAAAWLRDFLQEPDGVVTDSCTLQNGEVRKTIRFHRNASVKLLHMIARHVPYTAIPRSKIWLRSQVQEMQKSITLVQHDFNSKLGIVPVEIVSIAPYKHDKPGVTSVPVYDFTVDETHKYILAGGVIVSNSKRFGTLEQGAMVGHGAFDIIKDSKVIRGQSNSDFWRSIRTGGIPTMPGEPLVHKKFFAHLQGSGINVRRTPRGVSVFALSNGDIDQLAGSRELKSRDTYEAHNFRPIDGGLFGQDIFGMNGDKWAFIKLDEPLPNPVMEEPLARLLNMSDRDFVGVCSGEKEVNGMSSAADVKARLQKVDLEAEAAKALQDYKTANNSNKDKMLKRYVAIERMRRGGVQPADFMLDKIPVLPPQFRPVSSHNGLTMVADSNYLYAQLLDARDDLRESKDLPKSFQDEARRNVYDKWKELTGLYDPEDVKLREKHVQGLLKWALGTSPKFSGFQRKVLSATVDTVGRGAVVPDPRVRLNQLGIPREMAFNIMAPLVERGLVKRGYSPIDAMKMVKERKPQAEELLKEVMKTHPVLMNRAPTLHKLGIMAFDPVLVNGHVIHVNPSIVSPFNMDFDGDTVNIHAPVTDKAIQEARNKMFPERNLIAMRNREILYKPEKEYQQGLYLATHPKTDPNVRLRTFRSLDEAREAYRQGLLDINDPIEIKP